MAIIEEQWLAAWHRLSLDRTRPFFRDLWIRLEDEDQFVADLRGFIDSARRSAEYSRNSGALRYRLAEWFIEKYGRAGYASLHAWMLHIFLHGGPNRIPEKAWSSLLRIIVEAGASDAASGKIKEVRAILNRRDADLEARLEARSSSPVTVWDQQIMPIYSSDPEAIDTEISLISHYNNFLLAWSQVCDGLTFDQLREIDARGRAVATEQGWREHEVPFAGSWSFDLWGLIEAAKAGTVLRRTVT